MPMNERYDCFLEKPIKTPALLKAIKKILDE
jgi:hypothetical protein